MIVDQINDVKNHLNIAKRHIAEENFDKAIGEVENAIKSSTCSRCQKKMLISAYDIKHAKNVCELDSGRCTAIKQDIDDVIKEFVENYLPRVEDVLSAREKQ